MVKKGHTYLIHTLVPIFVKNNEKTVNRNEIITIDSAFVFACLANSSITNSLFTFKCVCMYIIYIYIYIYILILKIKIYIRNIYKNILKITATHRVIFSKEPAVFV